MQEEEIKERLNEVFRSVFGYDPEKSGHVGNKPITVNELRQVLFELSDEEKSEAKKSKK